MPSGVAPTAFYRHFRDMADLGVALVEEALSSLHTTLVSLLAATGDSSGDSDGDRSHGRVDRRLCAHASRARPLRRARAARRGAGRAVRDRRPQLALFAQEVADEFALEPTSAGWDDDDLLMLARMYVDHMVMTASALLEAAPGTEERVAAARAGNCAWSRSGGATGWTSMTAARHDGQPHASTPS